VSWDSIEEIEFITTANPMENYGAIGGTLNLVTRTGSNKFQGMASYYFTNRDLSQILLPLEHSNTLGIGQPSLAEYERDLSLRVSGPILKDRLWFVANYRRTKTRKPAPSFPTTINGKQYDNYAAPPHQTGTSGSSRPRSRRRSAGSAATPTLTATRPYDLATVRRPAGSLEATRHWAPPSSTPLSSQLTWTLSPQTLLDARFGVWRFKAMATSQGNRDESRLFRRVHRLSVRGRSGGTATAPTSATTTGR
jgi:hypothetical protein